MKRVILSLFALTLILVFSTAWAQQPKAEFSAYVAHFFAGSYTLETGEVDLDNTKEYGAVLDFPANQDVSLELSYSYAKTHSKYYPYYYYQDMPGQDTYDTDVAISYIFIGAIHEANRGNITPFGGGSFGVVIFSPTEAQYETVTHFALSFQLGVKVDLSEKLGIRAGGRFLLPLYFYGATVYAGSGGSGGAISAGIPIVEADLSIGLTVKM